LRNIGTRHCAHENPPPMSSQPHPLRTSRGRSAPLGATPFAEGVNFVLLCRHGTSVTLVVQSAAEDRVLAELALHGRKKRTGYLWHILVSGLPPAFRYGWRVDGPEGATHRFDPSLLLLDPSCTAVSDGVRWGTN